MTTTLECIKFFLWAMSMGAVLFTLLAWVWFRYCGEVLKLRNG